MSKVIVFRGKAGVGKTTVSNAVSQKLNISIIRKDDVYDSIASYIEKHETRNKACHETLLKMLETNILNGADVIIDAGFHNVDEIQRLREWVLYKNAVFIPLLCICSNQTVWAERINKRSDNPKPNNLITDFEVLKLHYIDLDTEPLIGEKVLDTIYDIDDIVDEAILEIKKFYEEITHENN